MNEKLVYRSLAACFATFALAVNVLGTNLGRTYDRIVEIRTCHVDHYFDYKGSVLHPPVKAAITTHAPGNQDLREYEELWYRDWDCIGCRRLGGIGLKPGQQVALHVSHDSGGSEREQAAAANAIVRLLLDCYANGAMVASVIVPDGSLSGIASAMRKASFIPGREAAPDEPVYTKLQLELRTPSGAKQVMYYGANRT